MKLIKKCSIATVALCVGVTLYACNAPSNQVSAQNTLNNNQASSYSQSLSRLTTSLDNIVNVSRLTSGNNGFTINANSDYSNQNQMRTGTNLRWNYNNNSTSNTNSSANQSQNGLNLTTSTTNTGSSASQTGNQTATGSGYGGYSNSGNMMGLNQNNYAVMRSNLTYQMENLISNAQDLRNTISTRNIDLSNVQNIDAYCQILDTASSNIRALTSSNNFALNLDGQSANNGGVSNSSSSSVTNTTTANSANIGTGTQNLNTYTNGYNVAIGDNATRLANRLLYTSVRVSNSAINSIRNAISGTMTTGSASTTDSTVTGNIAANNNTNMNSNTTNSVSNQSTQNMTGRRINGNGLTNPRNPRTSGNFVQKLSV